MMKLVFLCTFVSLISATAAFTEIFSDIGNYFGYGKASQEDQYEAEMYSQKIPYEVSFIDERFLNEAAELTGVALSELDKCQQRVVLKLKSDCALMNDEQLAKMAVHLLNCQSYIEGRQIYPCSEEMSIRECTTSMDSDTWTSYHLMTNRAKAVCYSIRQTQFRGLAEHTVNHLMEAAKSQLKNLGKISDTQNNLRNIAEKTYDALNEGHQLLSKQQSDMQKAQFYGQLAIEDNIKRLADEKRLIMETHNNLVVLTQNVQEKLEDSMSQMSEQVGESRLNHKELIEDLLLIQEKAKDIFLKIDQSSAMLLQQNEDFRKQYKSTLRSLQEMNQTVHTLVKLVGGTWHSLEEKLTWISSTLGGTDLALERIYLVLWHSAFLMIAMLTCAFLSVRPSTRLVVAVLPPINLAVALFGEYSHLDFTSLSGVIGCFIIAQTLTIWSLNLAPRVHNAITWKKDSQQGLSCPIPTQSNIDGSSKSHISSTSYNREFDDENFCTSKLSGDETNDTFKDFDFTPPVSRNGHYSRSRSRSQTPLLLNASVKASCRARTRVGTPCKLTSLPGRDFCFRHQNGDSVMG